ncbi:hypothetical protein N9893_01645, partial [bacterium]|nr:hypothetical protein [bacterium]
MPNNTIERSLVTPPYIVILYVQPLIFYTANYLDPFKRIVKTNDSSRKFQISLSSHLLNIFCLWLIVFFIVVYYFHNYGIPIGYNLENL